jgi:hypothetical protein
MTNPASASLTAVPHGRTARRLDWGLLPPVLRSGIERRLGSRVVEAHSAGAGYTPGFASTLTCEDGSRHFVKAANKAAQRPFAASYQAEAHVLAALPAEVPAPRLLWSQEDDLWVVLGLAHVDGSAPQRPWQHAQLEACLDTLETIADQLTPPPLQASSFARDFADLVGCWDHVRETALDLPHLEDAAALAARFADATAGSTLVHTAARDDNFLLHGTQALLCDWDFPVVGAAWIDTVSLLVSAHGDGLDADAIVDERRLTRDVAPADIDAYLALTAGYHLQRRDQPVPNSSPYLRMHQSWYAEAAWSWLARRRGWV